MSVTLYRKETLQCHIHLFRLLCKCDTTGRQGWSGPRAGSDRFVFRPAGDPHDLP